MTSELLLVTLMLFHGAVGVTFLTWPERLQQFAIRFNSGARGRFGNLAALIHSPKYLTMLQFVGAMSVTSALALLLFLLRHLRFGT